MGGASRGTELCRHHKAVRQPELPGDLPDRLAKTPRAIDNQIIRPRVRAERSQHDRRKRRPSLSRAEAVDLMKEGVLRGFARQDRDGAIAINENAMHALQEFCHHTYAAWAKFQSKLETVERLHKSRAGAKPGSKRGKPISGAVKTLQTS